MLEGCAEDVSEIFCAQQSLAALGVEVAGDTGVMGETGKMTQI